MTESGSADGVDNDAELTKNVTITVVDKGDGTLKATVSGNEGGKVAYTNTYDAEPDFITIPVVKDFVPATTGLTLPDIAGKYTFTISGSEGAPMPAVTSVNNDKDEEGNDIPMSFGPIKFEAVGEYTYTITEAAKGANVPGVSIDTDKHVTVTVTDDGQGHLVASSVELKNDKKVVFTNTYSVGTTTA